MTKFRGGAVSYRGDGSATAASRDAGYKPAMPARI
jgi:hypothetical protein